jgi:hypothetical protein
MTWFRRLQAMSVIGSIQSIYAINHRHLLHLPLCCLPSFNASSDERCRAYPHDTKASEECFPSYARCRIAPPSCIAPFAVYLSSRLGAEV